MGIINAKQTPSSPPLPGNSDFLVDEMEIVRIVHNNRKLSPIPSPSGSAAAAAVATSSIDDGEPSPSTLSSSATAVGASTTDAVAASIAPDHGLAVGLDPDPGFLKMAVEAAGWKNSNSSETEGASVDDSLDSIEKGKGKEAEEENKGKKLGEEKTEKKEKEEKMGERLKASKEKERKQWESKVAFPQRPGQSDCAFYLRTGDCKFGLECRFNHPQDLKRYKVELKKQAGVHQTQSEKKTVVDQPKLKKQAETNQPKLKKQAETNQPKLKKQAETNQAETNQAETNQPKLKKQAETNQPKLKNQAETNQAETNPVETNQPKLKKQAETNQPKLKKQGETNKPKLKKQAETNQAETNKPKLKKQPETNQVGEMEKEAPQTRPSLEESKMTFEVEGKHKTDSGCDKCEQIVNGGSILENDLVSIERTREKGEKLKYPHKANGPPCLFYMKTGTCKFGSTCNFNHPPWRNNNKDTMNKPTEAFQADGNKKKAASRTNKHKEFKVDQKKQKESSPRKDSYEEFKTDQKKQKEFTPRKDGDEEFKDATSPGLKKPAAVTLNFLDLPIRPRANVCRDYMRTGNCTFGVNCKYHHPDPAAINGPDPCIGYQNGIPAPHSTSGLMSPTTSSWLVAQSVPPYTSGMNYLSQGFNSCSEWKDHTEEYPNGPGQPRCQHYTESGVCMLPSSCKFCDPDIHLEENIVWLPRQSHNTAL